MYSKTKTPTKSQQIVCLISVLFIFSHCHQTVNIFQNLRDYESIDRILTVYVANKNGCVLCAAIVGASTLTDEFLICFGSSGFVSFCKYLQLNLKKKNPVVEWLRAEDTLVLFVNFLNRMCSHSVIGKD